MGHGGGTWLKAFCGTGGAFGLVEGFGLVLIEGEGEGEELLVLVSSGGICKEAESCGQCTQTKQQTVREIIDILIHVYCPFLMKVHSYFYTLYCIVQYIKNDETIKELQAQLFLHLCACR